MIKTFIFANYGRHRHGHDRDHGHGLLEDEGLNCRGLSSQAFGLLSRQLEGGPVFFPDPHPHATPFVSSCCISSCN